MTKCALQCHVHNLTLSPYSASWTDKSECSVIKCSHMGIPSSVIVSHLIMGIFCCQRLSYIGELEDSQSCFSFHGRGTCPKISPTCFLEDEKSHHMPWYLIEDSISRCELPILRWFVDEGWLHEESTAHFSWRNWRLWSCQQWQIWAETSFTFVALVFFFYVVCMSKGTKIEPLLMLRPSCFCLRFESSRSSVWLKSEGDSTEP